MNLPNPNAAILLLLIAIAPLLVAAPSQAQKDPDLRFATEVAGYTVRHVVFNSTFMLPDVAARYGLKRSRYESVLNVSVNPEGTLGSMPAEVRGTITNLMQQQKVLHFQQIQEKDATYYLAPIRTSNEDLLHFELQVTPQQGPPLTVKFSQTVYADE